MAALDYVILILVVTVACVLIASIAVPFITKVSMSADRLEMMANIMASVIAIISMYVGAKLQSYINKKNDKDK